MENCIDRQKGKAEFKKRIYGYVVRLVKFLSSLPKNIVANEVVKQLIRSGTSVGANYFEAQCASSKKDFQNFFRHSLKSANESKFWLNLLSDSGLIPEEFETDYKWLFQETTELANIFASSILTMKGRK